MRKLLSVLISIIVIASTIALILFMLQKNGVIDVFKSKEPDKMEYTNFEGKIYTEDNSVWEHVESNEPIVLKDLIVPSKNKVYLHLTGTDYYSIEIPSNYSYSNIMGKSIYADNGEFEIHIMSNTDITSLSDTSVEYDEGSFVNINSTTVAYSQSHGKFKKSYSVTIKSLIGETEYSIICTIYKGEDVYRCLVDSLNMGIDNLVSLNYDGESNNISSLPVYEGKYVARGLSSDFSLLTDSYKFIDGHIYFQAVANPVGSILNEYITLLSVLSNCTTISSYYGEGILYFTGGDYYLGMYCYNSNTTEVMIGKGEEANCNILDVLNRLNNSK